MKQVRWVAVGAEVLPADVIFCVCFANRPRTELSPAAQIEPVVIQSGSKLAIGKGAWIKFRHRSANVVADFRNQAIILMAFGIDGLVKVIRIGRGAIDKPERSAGKGRLVGGAVET